ncbi:hypothetical protein ACVINZ_000483 [Mesorhizobium jarvisii]
MNAQTALAQAEEKAPDQTALASYIEAAMQKAGVTVDPNTVKGIAAESLKPLQTYFDSTEWSSIKPQNPSGSTTPGKLSPNYVPMVPNKTN